MQQGAIILLPTDTGAKVLSNRTKNVDAELCKHPQNNVSVCAILKILAWNLDSHPSRIALPDDLPVQQHNVS